MFGLIYIDFLSFFVFLDLFKITFLVIAFSFYPKWNLFWTENKISLFLFSNCFLFSFLLKMFSKIQSNTFSSPFFVLSKNENRKRSNQTLLIHSMINVFNGYKQQKRKKRRKLHSALYLCRDVLLVLLIPN